LARDLTAATRSAAASAYKKGFATLGTSGRLLSNIDCRQQQCLLNAVNTADGMALKTSRDSKLGNALKGA
jgi:hypothetical protein